MLIEVLEVICKGTTRPMVINSDTVVNIKPNEPDEYKFDITIKYVSHNWTYQILGDYKKFKELLEIKEFR